MSEILNVHYCSCRKEERRKKAASGKAGGGAQGRETKTKSTKKKGGNKRRGGDDDWGDDDDEDVGKGNTASKKKGGGGAAATSPAKIELMSRSDLEAKIGAVSQLEDCPDEVFSELAARLYPTLTNKFRDALLELHRSTTAASMHDRSKSHSELQDRCNTAISHVRLFEKGLAHFDGQDRKALEKHLIKTQCAEMANALFDFLNSDEDGGGGKRKEVSTADDRVQVIKRVGKEEGEALLAIHKSLSGDDVSAFVSAVEDNAQAACDVFIRKSDKKKDRQMVFAHKHTLLEKLQACQDPALCLHLTLTVS